MYTHTHTHTHTHTRLKIRQPNIIKKQRKASKKARERYQRLSEKEKNKK